MRQRRARSHERERSHDRLRRDTTPHKRGTHERATHERGTHESTPNTRRTSHDRTSITDHNVSELKFEDDDTTIKEFELDIQQAPNPSSKIGNGIKNGTLYPTTDVPPKDVPTQDIPETKQYKKPPKDPRLVIKKLVLTNFKSYAGVQEIGPFNASFSAVVGPNGSGKSNVIDSMLFVFGFRALKMRQGKLSELIHNSDGDRSIDFCQVDIHFVHVIDDKNDAMQSTEVSGSELVIGRRAFKTNGSQYYINGASSTYTEVTGFLRAQGIDLDHKRFLILQGEVESIAQMKSKAEREGDDGLLEYLEDIIGTSNYKPMIDRGLVQVEELNQVCMEKENRYELVANDARTLEDKKNDALQLLRMEKELAELRSVKHQVSMREHQRRQEEHERVLAEVSAWLDVKLVKNADVERLMDALQQQKSALKSQVARTASCAAAVAKRQKKLSSETVALEEKLKNVGNKTRKAEKARTAAEGALTASLSRLENMQRDEQDAQSRHAELEARLTCEKKVLVQLRTQLQEKTSHLSAEIAQLQEQLAPHEDQMKAEDGRAALVRSEMEMMEMQKMYLKDKIRAASVRLVDIKAEGRSKEAQLDALQGKLAHIDEQIALGKEQCKNARKNLEAQRVRLASARTKTRDAVASVTSAQNRSKVLVSLMKLAKSGRIFGFFGRLGDLGEIDDKYDVAVSTACPALDSMVVESVETAQACIDYLRRNKLGYANFVCLDKLRSVNTAPFRAPGNPMSVKRLYDLITPRDARFLRAFYSKLRDTLVAGTLSEAKSVAYGPTRYKVVTLDGKVVDTSGTMSGGGSSVTRGLMQLRSRAVTAGADYSPEDVEQMKAELQTMERDVDQARDECQRMENDLLKLQELKPETEFQMQAVQLDIKALVAERHEVAATCKALVAQKEAQDASSDWDDAMDRLRAQLADADAARAALKLQMHASETRIRKLEQQVMDAGGVALKVQNAQVDSTRLQLELLAEKSSRDVIAMKKLENDLRRLCKLVADADTELEALHADASGLEDKLTERRRLLRELADALEHAQQQAADHETELDRVDEELDALGAQLAAFRCEEVELRNQLEKAQAGAKRLRHEVAALQEVMRHVEPRDATPYLEWMSTDERAPYSSDGPRQLSDEELSAADFAHIEQQIADVLRRMDDMRVDIEVLKEYGRKRQEAEQRREDLNRAVDERDYVRSSCEQLKRRRLDEFMEGFNTISLLLKVMYQMITMGGNAELELVDSLDPFLEGILFSVMPPKKSWKNISNLLGGEKTLSSLALVFALHQYKPTPLYVMDEIDAALDFRNVSIVANYIRERTKNAQFIVISLRNNMFELAQQLVGIYKVSNQTRSILMQNRDLLAA
ncbi:RecF/RecN/SMC protein [Metschnikowia bicuspidata]|uniref:Structural maintenance of chromosomes protein n=1 Tax=Metschnikowia bicuspidata TaxID=27322 RepID=A0A4P9ZFK0_9ASCO|nr:RecF/RecN/SMC protein [Metschnikowia bicuspidata]